MTSKSPTITELPGFAPVHPGEILKDELAERGLSATRLAAEIGVPGNRVSEIIAGRRAISADTALRLAAYLGPSAKFWLNLQQTFDLGSAQRDKGAEIAATIRPAA